MTARNKIAGSDLIYPEATPFDIDRHGQIIATGSYVPEKVVTNDDIIKEHDVFATARAVEFATGVKERRQVAEGETISDLLTKAARKCLDKAGIPPEKLDRIIYSKLVGEKIVPGTSLKVLKNLGVRTGIPAYDITGACSGFAHTLDLALRMIDSGDDYILILTGARGSGIYETFKKDAQIIFLLGDGACAVLVGPSDKKRFTNSYLYTNNGHFDVSYIPLGTALASGREAFTDDFLNMRMTDGKMLNLSAMESAEITTRKLLEDANLTIDDIDIFITSDQTPHLWKSILQAVNCPEEKSLCMSRVYANTVAAMTPLILDELIESGKLQRGMRVLMMAHGAGSSGGGFIFEY